MTTTDPWGPADDGTDPEDTRTDTPTGTSTGTPEQSDTGRPQDDHEDTADDDLDTGDRLADMNPDAAAAHYRRAAEKARREARNLRERLAEAEKKVGGIADRMQNIRRREAENAVRQLGGTSPMLDPSDLWRHGVDLDDVVDAEGNVDRSALDGRLQDLRRSRPYLFDTRSEYLARARGVGPSWGEMTDAERENMILQNRTFHHHRLPWESDGAPSFAAAWRRAQGRP